MIRNDFIENYNGFNIKQDLTIRKFKVYSVINYKVVYGSSVEILKRKIDKELKNE